MSKLIVLTEDTYGTFLITKEINKYYFNNKLVVESFHGIPHLKRFIENNLTANINLESYDKIIIIYDEAPGNPSIAHKLNLVNDFLDNTNIKERIHYFPVICFEYEVLIAQCIELFAKRNCHLCIANLKTLTENHGTQDLFAYTRRNNCFDNLYGRVKHKAEVDLIRDTGYIDPKRLRHKITFEAMCKLLFSDAFKNWLFIKSNFGKCWENDCCVKTSRDCTMTEEVTLTSDKKKLYLIQYTAYSKLVSQIEILFEPRVSVPEVNMNHYEAMIFDEQMLESNYIKKELDKRQI